MSKIIEVFADTGQVVERDRTEAEKKQYQADQEAAQKAQAAAETKAAQDAQATAAAIAHAKSLGFTDEMITVMYPNLGT